MDGVSATSVTGRMGWAGMGGVDRRSSDDKMISGQGKSNESWRQGERLELWSGVSEVTVPDDLSSGCKHATSENEGFRVTPRFRLPVQQVDIALELPGTRGATDPVLHGEVDQ
jgi:hypothetical protein